MDQPGTWICRRSLPQGSLGERPLSLAGDAIGPIAEGHPVGGPPLHPGVHPAEQLLVWGGCRLFWQRGKDVLHHRECLDGFRLREVPAIPPGSDEGGGEGGSTKLDDNSRPEEEVEKLDVAAISEQTQHMLQLLCMTATLLVIGLLWSEIFA
jgi:hypothetical protein